VVLIIHNDNFLKFFSIYMIMSTTNINNRWIETLDRVLDKVPDRGQVVCYKYVYIPHTVEILIPRVKDNAYFSYITVFKTKIEKIAKARSISIRKAKRIVRMTIGAIAKYIAITNPEGLETLDFVIETIGKALEDRPEKIVETLCNISGYIYKIASKGNIHKYFTPDDRKEIANILKNLVINPPYEKVIRMGRIFMTSPTENPYEAVSRFLEYLANSIDKLKSCNYENLKCKNIHREVLSVSSMYPTLPWREVEKRILEIL